jgi:hypothetical protein
MKTMLRFFCFPSLLLTQLFYRLTGVTLPMYGWQHLLVSVLFYGTIAVTLYAYWH